MALGAEPGAVMRMIVLKGLRPSIGGVVIGVAASYGLSRLLANQIYGVKATDPWTFAAAVTVLVAVGTNSPNKPLIPAFCRPVVSNSLLEVKPLECGSLAGQRLPDLPL
jgi:hypothetical protein